MLASSLRAIVCFLALTTGLIAAGNLPQDTAGTPAPKSFKTGEHTLASSISAAPNPAQPAVPSSSKPSREIVKVKIGTMRRTSVAGQGLGIYAELENLADAKIIIFDNETTLVIPPYLTGNGVCAYSLGSMFPTEMNVHSDPPTKDPRGSSVTLAPGAKYRAVWDLSYRDEDKRCDSDFWGRVWGTIGLRMAGFVPGPYNFTVEGKAYFDLGRSNDYYTFIENADLLIEIPQYLVIIGAIVGGWLGYLVSAIGAKGDFARWTELQTKRQYLGFAWMIVYKMLSAALLSVVVTILLSRLADTQFAIKVSVSDFWGAITVGFLSYFVGSKLIDQILQTANSRAPS